jgi:SEC-C motif-containing protein
MLKQLCPCGSGLSFAACCGPFLAGEKPAPTALALMRSRYSAYCLGNAVYLLNTWQPRPKQLDLDPEVRWLGLKILGYTAGGEGDDQGTVHFQARYKIGGHRAERMEENSRFQRIGGRWYYLDSAPHNSA